MTCLKKPQMIYNIFTTSPDLCTRLTEIMGWNDNDKHYKLMVCSLQPWKSPRIWKRYVQVQGCPEGAYLKWMWLDFQINVLQTRINEQQKLWVTVNEECEARGCCVVFAVRVLEGHKPSVGQRSRNRKAGRQSQTEGETHSVCWRRSLQKLPCGCVQSSQVFYCISAISELHAAFKQCR